MTLHFVINDHSLRNSHKQRYDKVGRWLLSSAILVGWILGLLIELHEAAIASIFAFLSGGILLNVMKEELPGEKQSRIAPFIIGAVSYAILLLTLSAMK